MSERKLNGPSYVLNSPVRKQATLSLIPRRFRRRTFPDFLGIGAQKSGTTWLYRNLSAHEELFLPRRKELHYFDGRLRPPLLFYENRFRLGIWAGKVSGEITPAYSFLPDDVIRFIHHRRPDLKLVLLLRNPVDRAWSHASMALRKGKLGSAGGASVSDEALVGHFRSRASLDRGSYTEILDRWESVFPASQLYVSFFERISAEPTVLLNEIFGFLGVSQVDDWSGFPVAEVVFGGSGQPFPEHLRAELADLYRDEIEALYRRFGAEVEHWRC